MEARIKAPDRTSNIWAFSITVLFHGALFLLCYLYIIRTPIPPFAEAGGGGGGLGIEVNLGNSDFGTGMVQDEISMPDFSTASAVAGSDDNVLTQDNETTTSLNSTPGTTQTSEADINQNAIYKGNRTGHSQGTNGGTGDQGNPDGNPGANGYTGSGHGPGSGGGDGGGHGTGHGPGYGPGSGPGTSKINYNLENRTYKLLPKPNYNSREEGIVVVSIWVDKSGNVTKAIAGARGTTTTNANLLKIATDAAYKAKFQEKADAPFEQKGTITYNFVNLN